MNETQSQQTTSVQDDLHHALLTTNTAARLTQLDAHRVAINSAHWNCRSRSAHRRTGRGGAAEFLGDAGRGGSLGWG